jgi:hypothetical protein
MSSMDPVASRNTSSSGRSPPGNGTIAVCSLRARAFANMSTTCDAMAR